MHTARIQRREIGNSKKKICVTRKRTMVESAVRKYLSYCVCGLSPIHSSLSLYLYIVGSSSDDCLSNEIDRVSEQWHGASECSTICLSYYVRRTHTHFYAYILLTYSVHIWRWRTLFPSLTFNECVRHCECSCVGRQRRHRRTNSISLFFALLMLSSDQKHYTHERVRHRWRSKERRKKNIPFTEIYMQRRVGCGLSRSARKWKLCHKNQTNESEKKRSYNRFKLIFVFFFLFFVEWLVTSVYQSVLWSYEGIILSRKWSF